MRRASPHLGQLERDERVGDVPVDRRARLAHGRGRLGVGGLEREDGVEGRDPRRRDAEPAPDGLEGGHAADGRATPRPRRAAVTPSTERPRQSRPSDASTAIAAGPSGRVAGRCVRPRDRAPGDAGAHHARRAARAPMRRITSA